jgi:hypothetical protein
MQEVVLNKIKLFPPKPRPRLIEPLAKDQVHETRVHEKNTVDENHEWKPVALLMEQYLFLFCFSVFV